MRRCRSVWHHAAYPGRRCGGRLPGRPSLRRPAGGSSGGWIRRRGNDGAAAHLSRPLRVGGVPCTVAILVGAVSLFGAALQRYARRCGPLGSVVVTAAATWVALGGTSLARLGSAMGDLLGSDDLEGARRLLPSLCGRDPALLDAAGLTRATVESIAENTSDAQVAPLMWAVAGGVPGVLGYRAVNTLDAMIGHRSPRYARFGWAAAKLDDAANYVTPRGRPQRWTVGVRADRPRLAVGRADRVASRCAATPQPQRRCRRSGIRRSVGRATRRAHPVPLRVADPAGPRCRSTANRQGSAPRRAAFACGASGYGAGARRAHRRRP